MRLGINEQTGRLQWCPGLTCNKLFIIFPAFMLLLMLIVLLLFDVNGFMANLPVRPQPYIWKYTNKQNDLILNLTKDPLTEPHPLMPDQLQKNEVDCLSLKIRLSENTEIEDRNIMKDSQTSFIPQYSSIYSINCPESRAVDKTLRTRTRRTSNSYQEVNLKSAVRGSSLEFDESFISTQSAIQSYWNEHGTKETIREAQAKRMLKYIDQNVDPCEDFYKYACGNWEHLHPIPKDKAGYDTFEMLRENLDIILKELLESNDADDIVEHKRDTFDLDSNTVTEKQNSDLNPMLDVSVELPLALPQSATNLAQLQTDVQQVDAEELLSKIIRRRHLLSRLLLRYKRQTTLTKRKRLFPFLANFDVLKKSANRSATNAKQKAKYLYQSCINRKQLDARGIKPLLQLVNSLGGWPVLDTNWNSKQFDWLNLTAQLRRYNNDILIVQWVGPDIKNSNENVIQFDQTTLGLPTREYFLQDVNTKYLKAYQRFMTDIMAKLGATAETAAKAAEDLLNFETQLASITSPAEQRLNVTKLYKRISLKELSKEVPEIDWVRYLTILQERSVQDSEEIVVYAIDYMKDLVGLIQTTDEATLANYLMWRFIRHRINNVDDRFEESKQAFYHSLFGREESPSRWKVCIAQVNTNMGMALGAMFVTKYFDENSKQDTLKMTHELQQAFREILQTTDWLDFNTRHLAEQKVNDMSLKIGYPDFILNSQELDEKYAGIEIQPDKYFENTLNVLLHTSKTEQNKINEPVNKTNWQTAPAIVNAYYSRNKNQIMFPAGILQPPFYHRHFPRALNFGGIGVVIGHELTHGFDDKGRLFDSNGNIHKWWSDAAIKGFDERARCIISQYGNYTVDEVGISLNGESTQGENIADNGGIRQAFHAYKEWLDNNPKMEQDEHMPHINMTGPQLFFLNFGQVWCGAMRPEAVRNKLNTAIHSPGRFRVIGTLSNSVDFAREFKCRLDSPMNPKNKCSVW